MKTCPACFVSFSAVSAVLILAGFSTISLAADTDVTSEMRELNKAVLQKHARVQTSHSEQIGELRDETAAVIEHRAAALASLIKRHPGQALSFAFSPDLLADLAAKFPKSASLLESHGTWEGPVEQWTIENANLKSHSSVTRMKVGGRMLDVHFAGPVPEGLKSGDMLMAHGVSVGNTLAVSSAITTTATATACSNTGAQNTAVLLVTFPGATPPSYITPQNATDMFFGATGPSLDGFWREVSSGKTSAMGGVFGWYTLDASYANCGRLDLLRDAAVAAATNAGVNFQNYSRIFIVTAGLGCGWTGLSMGGCMSLNSPTGPFTASTSYLDAGWQRSQLEGAQNAAHEGGHNMGLAHAQSRTFGTEPLGPLGAAGTLTEYGDPFSDMGTSNIGHYAAPHKAEMLNWISSGTNYQVVQSSGSWTLQPAETNPAGLMALKVQRGSGNNAWLWVEYRQPIGNYDSTLWPAPTSGALIHYEDSTTGGYTQLLDFTPATTQLSDGALMPGTTWSDPYTNLSITVQSATANALTVAVNYGTTPCTHATPTVSISPANPNVYAGSGVNYTLSVINNDSAGCTASTFSLSSTQPLGWSNSLPTPSLTLNPGQTGTATLTETAPVGTTPATYAIGASAANGTISGTGSANCTLVASPAFSVSVSVASLTYSARQTVSMIANVQNGGVPAGGATVTFTMTKSNGSKATKSTVADSTGKSTWSYKLGAKDPSGTYSVIVQAVSGSQTATSNLATFTVQ